MKEKFHIDGIKKILLKWHKHIDLLNNPDPARALYGPPPKTAAGERGFGLVNFFKQVSLFEDLSRGTSDGSLRSSTSGPTGTASTFLKRGNPVRRCTSFEVAS
jgi:hypothetical protein